MSEINDFLNLAPLTGEFGTHETRERKKKKKRKKRNPRWMLSVNKDVPEHGGLTLVKFEFSL